MAIFNVTLTLIIHFQLGCRTTGRSLYLSMVVVLCVPLKMFMSSQMNNLSCGYKVCIVFAFILASGCQANNYSFMGCEWKLPDSVEFVVDYPYPSEGVIRRYSSKDNVEIFMQISFYAMPIEQFPAGPYVDETISKSKIISEDFKKGFYIRKYHVAKKVSEIITSLQTISNEDKFILLYNVNDNDINAMLSHCK